MAKRHQEVTTSASPAQGRARRLARGGVLPTFKKGPAKRKRPRAHAEALATMYRAARDAMLWGDASGSGCCAVLYWQATQENPAADARERIAALNILLAELADQVEAWCEHLERAVVPGAWPGKPSEPAPPAAVAQRVTSLAWWFDRSAHVLSVGAAELTYLASELEGASAARPVALRAATKPSVAPNLGRGQRPRQSPRVDRPSPCASASPGQPSHDAPRGAPASTPPLTGRRHLRRPARP